MARLSKQLSEQDYEDLVMELLQSTDPDAEIQDCISAYLRPNQKFYLMMSRAISKIRDAATLSSDGGQISDSENLESNLYELENRLLENSNIIPADLPDSILNDRDLVGRHLADNSKIIYQKDEWRDFQSYIEDKVGTISKNLELPFLEWCDKMLKRNYAKHKEICTKPANCPMNEGYDKRIQYITRLIEDATPIQPEQTQQMQMEVIRIAGKKIQWLGNQKELAELFVELKKKGWIEKFEYDTIQDCFTESHSIPQYLRPATDRKTKADTYEKLYSGYSPQFYGIRENTKRHK